MKKRKITYADLCINGFKVVYENRKATATKSNECSGNSQPQNITYKEFDNNDIVKFNPVSYELCTSGDNCYDWAVLSKNDKEYDLVLITKVSDFSWSSGGQNPVDVIKGATTSWSSKLKMDTSHDITVNSTYGYKFSEAKGRILTLDEFNSSNIKGKVRISCDESAGNTACILIDPTNNKFKKMNFQGVSDSRTFAENASGDVDSANIKIVIHIDLTKDVGNVEDTSTSNNHVYNVGDVVYYDPVSTTKCDSTTFNITNVKSGDSTCYKWHIIEAHDNAKSDKVNIQLDHNVAATDYVTESFKNGAYNVDYYAQVGPIQAIMTLKNNTNSWTRLPLLTYEYDVSDIGNSDHNYGFLVCYNGKCRTNSVNSGPLQNVRARLITADEVTEIGKSVTPALSTTNNNYPAITSWTRTASGDRYYFSNSSYINNKDLKWLVESTSYDSSSDATSASTTYADSNTYGYWTLTPDKNYYSQAWVVNYSGILNSYTMYNSYNNYGVRPVVTVPKADLK